MKNNAFLTVLVFASLVTNFILAGTLALLVIPKLNWTTETLLLHLNDHLQNIPTISL
jgi:hypothetical protein